MSTERYGQESRITGSGNAGLLESKSVDEFVALIEMLRDKGWEVVSHTHGDGRYTALMIKTSVLVS